MKGPISRRPFLMRANIFERGVFDALDVYVVVAAGKELSAAYDNLKR
ncbi:hypothetical protein WNY77_18245 [Paraglaciecola mesophila]|uniref:Uncharacterized protein n=1 Tax=Paraglaciecola mesophila TaxID=197222 RepID=A0ABU9SZQ8_9ALTE